ncbi:MAG: VOC family protein [Bdellovibrionota bacterium]
MLNIGAYFEIPVLDLDRAMAFYAKLLNCDFTQDTIHGNKMAFFPLYNGEPGITGGLCKGDTYKPSLTGTLIYLTTENIDASLERVVSMKAEILFPKTSAGEWGEVAEFKDSEGNRVALFQAKVKS